MNSDASAVLLMFGAPPARVVVEKNTLSVWQAGFLWARSRTWARDTIAEVSVGESSIGGGDDSMHPDVKVRLVVGEKFGFLRGRYPQELDRTVQLIRDELRLRS